MTARNPALKARNARRPKPRATSRAALSLSLAEHRSIVENAPASAGAFSRPNTSALAPGNVDAQHSAAIEGGMSPEVVRDLARAHLPEEGVGLDGEGI